MSGTEKDTTGKKGKTYRDIASAFAGRKVGRRDLGISIILLLVPVVALGLALVFSGRTAGGFGTLVLVPLSLVIVAIVGPLEKLVQTIRSRHDDD